MTQIQHMMRGPLYLDKTMLYILETAFEHNVLASRLIHVSMLRIEVHRIVTTVCTNFHFCHYFYTGLQLLKIYLQFLSFCFVFNINFIPEKQQDNDILLLTVKTNLYFNFVKYEHLCLCM